MPVVVNVVILSASGTYTPSSWAKYLYVECFGAGGGGGGAVTGVGNSAVGGGGGSGGYAAKLITSPAASYSVTVGSGGSGSSGANGGDGSDTVFPSSPACTAKGGKGGLADSGGTGTAFTLGGAGGAQVGGADVVFAGNAGSPGLRVSASVALSGAGAAGPFGGAVAGRITSGTGGQGGGGYGDGGAGGCLLNGDPSVAGGNGGSGLIRVMEIA
jgi:hypothetical protein